ncbi:hypothetical protein PIIN_03505 [Serendipita indica DSM 11827]|uniref:C2H2-type domain-containing protein n=1 Tax=Serendipita indica (strain DSM 11827) TaxID=1109443 RepID=G4TE45_SERID|nr:hypothetical protein PIIN_03505 [Serendipita indica DSM 11827]
MSQQQGSGSFHTFSVASPKIESPERPFPCPNCPARFQRKRDMERHRRSVHATSLLTSQPYECGGCDERFPRSDARARHWKNNPECEEIRKAREEAKQAE